MRKEKVGKNTAVDTDLYIVLFWRVKSGFLVYITCTSYEKYPKDVGFIIPPPKPSYFRVRSRLVCAQLLPRKINKRINK